MTEWGSTSSGVFISRRAAGEMSQPKIIRAKPPARAKAMVVCTARWVPSVSQAPNSWEMTTAAPEEMPTNSPTSRLMRVLVAPPTAARACLPTYCPTMTASAVLYSCWKKVPSRMGKKKESSVFQITPPVMLFCCGWEASMPLPPYAEWSGFRDRMIAQRGRFV